MPDIIIFPLSLERKLPQNNDFASLITQGLSDKWTNVMSDTLITSVFTTLTWIMYFSWEGDQISHRNNGIRDGYNMNQFPDAQLLKKYDQIQYLITSYISSTIKLSKIHVLSIEESQCSLYMCNMMWYSIRVQSNFAKSRKSIFIKGMEFRKEIIPQTSLKKKNVRT